MAERALRGPRLGATSYENDRNTDLAPRQEIAFDCPKGHHFSVPFAAEAEIPATWECRVCGAVAFTSAADLPTPKKVKPPRSHWDMLRERRSISDLEQVLAERLPLTRGERGIDGNGKDSQRKSAYRRFTAVPDLRFAIVPARPGARARAASGTPGPPEPAAAPGDPPDGDPPQGFQHDRPAHLRRAVHAFHERDRHLDHPQPGAQRPHRQVDLEAVPLGLHLVQPDRAERLRPVGAVAAGGVHEPDAEHDAGVGVAAA